MITPIIYAAGPVDLSPDAKDWRKLLSNALDKHGVRTVLFDPSVAFKLSDRGTADCERSAYIESVNQFALEHANVMVASIPLGSQTIGTPIEIDTAVRNGLPTYLITGVPRGVSIYLDNRIDFDKYFFIDNKKNSLESAITHCALSIIEKINYNA